MSVEVSELQARAAAMEASRNAPKDNSNPNVYKPKQPTASTSGDDTEIIANGIDALKAWTGKGSAQTIYDSSVDGFTHDALFQKVQGKPNVAVIAFTADGDVFGGCYSRAVTEQDKWVYDRDIFIFSLESRGRCETPQKFDVKKVLRDEVSVTFWKNNPKGFVGFWVHNDDGFHLGNERSKTVCHDLSHGFVGLEDTTLTGMNGTGREGPYHRCTRLVAVQLQ